MDVDTDNFEAALEVFQRHLPRANFVAVDVEMIGICGILETQVCDGDVPQVQYSKACAVVNRPYNIVQVGLCLFEEASPRHFECRPFNVYVFPRPVDEKDPYGMKIKSDQYLGLSASTALFLTDNGFDFQRWVTKGVSYVPGTVEAALAKVMASPENSALA